MGTITIGLKKHHYTVEVNDVYRKISNEKNYIDMIY